MTLPTTFSWPLIVPSFLGGSAPSGSYLSPGPGIATCVPSYFTEADLLAILDNLLPEWYLQPLKDPGPGYEVLQAFAKMLERASLAVGRFECSSYVISSHGGARAVGTVEFYRSNTSAGAYTVLKGTIVRTSKTNRSYRTIENVEMGALDLVVSAQVESLGFGAEYNVLGPTFAADGTALPGEIDKVAIPLLDPLFADPTIQVRQVSDMAGGQAAVLDQLGNDRLLPRLPDETDELYKARIRALPDTISPDALVRTLDSIFIPLGLDYDFIETWENRYQTCWDAPESAITHPTMGTVEIDCFAYDDPRTDPFRGRWMDDRDCPAGMVVVVPDLVAWSERGMAYDDPAETVADHETTLGRRSVSAYDAPDQDVTDLLWVGFYDGYDAFKKLFYKRLWDLLRQIKGGGEHVAIELEGQ